MNNRELKLLQDLVKKRYDKAGLDYKTFDGDIDTDITYEEQKNIIIQQLDTLLPKTIPKLKRETQIAKEQEQALLKAEQEKQEAEIKARLDKEIEMITKDSKEMENLYDIPNRYIEMVAKKQQRGLLLYGESSLGKSYRVKSALKKLNLKQYIYCEVENE